MFSDKLRKLREDKGLTQHELANQLFVTRSAVAKWEQNRGIPNPDSMESIAVFFNVDKHDLLNQEDAVKALYTIQSTSNYQRKQNTIILGVLFVVSVVFLAGIFLWKEMQKEKYYYDEFFSETLLNSFSLPDFPEIDKEGIHLTTSEDNYYAVIEDDFDVKEYASYVLNYLLESPHISFVGFDIDRTTVNYEQTNKKFIAPSVHINDYQYALGYRFYYIDFLDSNRDSQTPIHFKSISIDTQYYTIINSVDYNLCISLRDTRSYSYFEYYLFDEFYDANIIKINNDNIENYFDIKLFIEDYVKDYFIVVFSYRQYFIHANIELDLVVKYEDQVFSEHRVIKKGYDWSTYIFIYTDTYGWDETKIEIVSYDVSYGDMWILE